MGGGITGDLQVNDTHLHSPLKSNYRMQESALMVEKLRKEPNKISSPSRDVMMIMLNKAVESADVDFGQAFKLLFVTNKFDSSEDFFVSGSLYSLVGEEMVQFRKELVKTTPPPKNSKRTDENHNVVRDPI